MTLRRVPAAEVSLLVGGLAEVGFVVAGHHPQLEGRARGPGCEADAGGVVEDESVAPGHLRLDEPAPGADAFADDVARGSTKLLADAVRDVRQVIDVEAEMVGHGTGLLTPVLDDLQVLRAAALGLRAHDALAGQRQHLDDDGLRLVAERSVMAERRHDGLPGADVPEQAHGQLLGSAVARARAVAAAVA